MPINHRTAPQNSASALRSRLQSLVDAGALDRLLNGGDPAALHATEPHPVYELGLDDARAGTVIGGARHSGWRYLLTESSQARLAAEHGTTSKDPNPHVQVTAGDHVQGTVDAIEVATKLPEVASNDYELRVLRVPSLYLFTVWLHGPDDLFIPIASMDSALKAKTMYREADVASALRSAAARLPNPIP